jgi:hypothetical protein
VCKIAGSVFPKTSKFWKDAMLTRLAIRNFKLFDDAEIELGERVVFIGPNNAGKTSALQALALWDLGAKRWLEKRGTRGQSAMAQSARPRGQPVGGQGSHAERPHRDYRRGCGSGENLDLRAGIRLRQ